MRTAQLAIILAIILTSPTLGEVYRWDNGLVISGTEGIVPAREVALEELDLSYANLRDLDLSESYFTSSNLTEARFVTYDERCDVCRPEAFLTGAVLFGANLSNAWPIVITTNTAHGLASGDKVVIYNVLGNTNADGAWTTANPTSTTFELVGSAGNGAYQTSALDKVDKGLTVTSALHGLINNEPVIIAGVLGNTAANGFWRVKVVDANQFRIYGLEGEAIASNGAFSSPASGCWNNYPEEILIEQCRLGDGTQFSAFVYNVRCRKFTMRDSICQTGVGNTGPAVVEWSLPDEATESIVVENCDFYFRNTTGNGKVMSTNSVGNLLSTGKFVYLGNRIHNQGLGTPATANSADRQLLASTRDASGREFESNLDPTTNFLNVTFRRGDIVWKVPAVSGQVAAWVCTADGPPATWKVLSTLP